MTGARTRRAGVGYVSDPCLWSRAHLCVVLCCDVLCYAMLCYDMLCCAVLSNTVLCCVCCALPCYAMLCYAVWCGVVLRCAALFSDTYPIFHRRRQPYFFIFGFTGFMSWISLGTPRCTTRALHHFYPNIRLMHSCICVCVYVHVRTVQRTLRRDWWRPCCV